jgi:type I restriction enzyme S subunit
MKRGKMSEPRLSGLNDEQDLGTQKILKSSNQANSDVDNMKQGWEIAGFEKCLEKVTYTNKIQRKDFKEEGVYPIVSQEKDFINGYWDNEEDLFRVDKPVVIFGDHTQVIKFIDFDFVLGADGVKILKPKNKIDSKYFYYFLQNIDLGSLGYARHYRLLKEINVAYPKSLPEQQRIVSTLDECFAAIAKAKANAEQNLKNAKELFESYLQGVFEKKGEGWEERKVNEIGNAQTGTTPKTAEKENYGDFIPFIKPADVDFSGIGDIRYDNEGLSEIGLKKGRKMESGSILMVCIGATIGKVGFAEREVSCNQQINSLSVKKEFEPKFIYYAMTSKEFQEKVLLEGKGAQATLPIINKSKWENLTISFPKSKNEQQTIVRQLDALRAETQKLEAVYQKKIADLEELKKSILQKAFAGELKTEKAVIV